MWSSLASRVRPTAAHHSSVAIARGVGVAHAVTNVVVVTDRIERLALGIVAAAL